MSQLELISFIPKTACYQIWHPKEFIVNESDDGILTITSPITYSNLTISTYTADRIVTENILVDFLNEVLEQDTSLSEVKKITIKNRIWIEQEYKDNKGFWVWWALSEANQVVMASVNSEEILNDSDRHLFTFMIDKMEIYPEKPDDSTNIN